MRKTKKVKKKSCAMCKAHKMGYANRWKPKQFLLLREFERERERRLRR